MLNKNGVDGWMVGQTSGEIDGWTDKWMNGWTDGHIHGWTNERMKMDG